MPLEHLCELTPVVALLSFEHYKQQLAVFKQAAFFTMHFSTMPHLILCFLTYLYMCIYIGGPLFYKIHSSIPTEITNVLKARHA